MPATSCSKVYLRLRRFGLATSITSLPSRTSMLAGLPTLAPISCANAFGTRSARLLPYFKNSTFTTDHSYRRYNVDIIGSDVNCVGVKRSDCALMRPMPNALAMCYTRLALRTVNRGSCRQA
jgi:hypothetical protein